MLPSYMTWSHFLVKPCWSLHNATRRIVHEQQHTRGQLNTECVRCNATAKTRFFFPDDASSAKFECKVVLHGDKILKWFKINAQPFVFAVVVTIITSYWRNIFTHTLTHNHPSPFTFGMLSRGQTPREHFFLPSTLSCKLTRKSKISFLFKKKSRRVLDACSHVPATLHGREFRRGPKSYWARPDASRNVEFLSVSCRRERNAVPFCSSKSLHSSLFTLFFWFEISSSFWPTCRSRGEQQSLYCITGLLQTLVKLLCSLHHDDDCFVQGSICLAARRRTTRLQNIKHALTKGFLAF